MKITELNHTPSITSSYIQLFLKRKCGIKEGQKLPELKYLLQDCLFDTNHLQQFNELCNIKDNSIFISYPYAVAGPLMLSLVASENFPIPAAGLLHLRNSITLNKPLEVSKKYTIEVSTSTTRFRPQGLEFELLTQFKEQSETVWQCKSTFLKRGKFRQEDPASEDENLFIKLEDSPILEERLSVPGNIGKLYAKVCKDYNPIHISNLAAKLFGYKRSIAHGMWVLTRTTAHLAGQKELTQLDAAFKGPVFTKSEVSFKKSKNDINIFCGSNPRPVILAKMK